MKIKWFQNYYSKLTLFSLAAVVSLVVIITGVALFSMNNTRINDALSEYDDVLWQLTENYNDIWSNYYKAFGPLTEEAYAEVIEDFCKEEASDDNHYVIQQNFKHVLANICRQDSKIKGIYFQRLSDGACYLYTDSSRQLEKVEFESKKSDSTEPLSRTLIGGQILESGALELAKKELKVFGIQSRVLTVGGNQDSYEYQVTVLYGLDSFDDIAAKKSKNTEPRFWIVSPQGVIIYDSNGVYTCNQESYFTDIGRISREGNTFVQDQAVYMKNLKVTDRGNCLVFYTIPQSAVTAFQWNGMAGLVIVFAIIIIMILILAMFSINKLSGRKFHELECGMHQIGKNHLHYRIPIGKQNDEFTRVALKFNEMCDDLEDMINKNYVYQVLQRNAEYKALETSVNPHFLYNSLEAIREKLDNNGQEDEAEMILLLSRIFEYQVRDKSIVTVQRELNALQNYIDFSAIRLQYAFEYLIDFEDEILDYKIPKQIFQPIMENYFVHGFRGDGTDFIRILGYIDSKDQLVHICFCDNGKGISQEKLEQLRKSLDMEAEDNFHIGLRNVHNRLKIVYGKESCVDISNNTDNKGISITLIFGKIKECN